MSNESVATATEDLVPTPDGSTNGSAPDSYNAESSRSSRAWRRFASARACTSAPPVSGACTTWSTRWSTTPSTRRWPATATHRGRRCCADGGVRVVDNGRGIPVDDAPGREAAGGRGRAHRATRRRQVRRRRLRGLRRPARRRRLRRQRVVEPARGRDHRDGYVWRQSYELGVPTAPLANGAQRPTRPAPRITFWADAEIFETTDVHLRDAVAPLPGDGVPQQGPDH